MTGLLGVAVAPAAAAAPARAAVPVVAAHQAARAVAGRAAAPAPAAAPLSAPAKPATTSVGAAGVPCTATVAACIDLAHNRAWLLRGGAVQYGPVPITSGRAGYRTPAGTFRVLSRERLHLSRQFDDAPMPYSVFFYPGDAFHQGSLAVPSHGCIHLS
ncbi:MAG TPA: L,D-transpeptidase, partial [Pseudonocardia sp.]